MQKQTANLGDHCRAPLKMAWYYRRLLLDWANVGDKPTETLRRLHPRVIAAIAGEHSEFVVTQVRMLLQRAWDSDDARKRTWFLTLARELYARGRVATAMPFLPCYATFPGLPEGDAGKFDAALSYAQTKLAPKMQVCRAAIKAQSNQAAVKCAAPYFFREERGQKYCSTDCSEPVRDAGQREYWAMRGRLLRAKRLEKQKLLALKKSR
jgi:hypothetical protein